MSEASTQVRAWSKSGVNIAPTVGTRRASETTPLELISRGIQVRRGDESFTDRYGVDIFGVELGIALSIASAFADARTEVIARDQVEVFSRSQLAKAALPRNGWSAVLGASAIEFPDRVSALTLSDQLRFEWHEVNWRENLAQEAGSNSALRLAMERLGRVSEQLRDDGDALPTPASVNAFERFFQLGPQMAVPAITVTDAGEIYARWRRSGEENLAIRFFSIDRVEFALFSPDEPFPLADECSVAQLFETIKFRRLTWVVV